MENVLMVIAYAKMDFMEKTVVKKIVPIIGKKWISSLREKY